jgi:hypothetical protein
MFISILRYVASNDYLTPEHGVRWPNRPFPQEVPLNLC